MKTASIAAAALVCLSLSCQKPSSEPSPEAPARAAPSVKASAQASAQASAAPEAPSREDEVEGARKYFTDAVLVNQDNRPMRFYSDVIQGKTVIINSFFTSCTGSCLAMAATLAKLQDRLGDRLGNDVFIASISVDAENDTPDKLKAYALKHKAKKGWFFFTGEEAVVGEVVRKLGERVNVPNDHSAIIIAGNDRTGLWKKVFGLAQPEEVIRVVQSVVDDRGEDPPQ